MTLGEFRHLTRGLNPSIPLAIHAGPGSEGYVGVEAQIQRLVDVSKRMHQADPSRFVRVVNDDERPSTPVIVLL